MRGVSESELQALPQSIWMPGAPLTVYRGTPAEIVASMAQEMGENVTVREAVTRLCAALATYRKVVIGLPADVPDEMLARLFVFALLDTGMAKPMAIA